MREHEVKTVTAIGSLKIPTAFCTSCWFTPDCSWNRRWQGCQRTVFYFCYYQRRPFLVLSSVTHYTFYNVEFYVPFPSTHPFSSLYPFNVRLHASAWLSGCTLLVPYFVLPFKPTFWYCEKTHSLLTFLSRVSFYIRNTFIAKCLLYFFVYFLMTTLALYLSYFLFLPISQVPVFLYISLCFSLLHSFFLNFPSTFFRCIVIIVLFNEIFIFM